MGRFAFLEDVALADCAVEVEGGSLDDLFETSAAALAELMVEPATVPIEVERTITLTATDLDLLLYDWLSELIYLKDRDREVFTRVKASVSGNGPFHLMAQAQGGAIDPERTALRSDPKAVTFHQFSLTQVGGAWRARIVIDI